MAGSATDKNSPKVLRAEGGWRKWPGQPAGIEHCSTIEGLMKFWDLWALDFGSIPVSSLIIVIN